MRWFAFYLPQYYETVENDKWWGKGFTEWTHVKAAKPIFKGHFQPVVPLSKNYYNLLDKQTVEWQTSLMKQYGIDGFVYYHYYFCGKRLLEKPAENLLQWTDIDQPFFFCWANHTWYQAKNGVKRVLIKQCYGDELDWERHFHYLLPFFKDSRYEKKDNKPVFMIYDPNFDELKPMMKYFDSCCKKNGFDGIYIIEVFSDASTPNNFSKLIRNKSDQTEKICIREPAVSKAIWQYKQKYTIGRLFRKVCRELAYRGIISSVEKYDGSKLLGVTFDKEYPRGDNLCHGVCFSWDNTPRHGVRGYIITPPTKEMFMKYADSIRDDEFVFVNAWNEWAEGMMLEPTERDGYKYLEWISEWKNKH